MGSRGNGLGRLTGVVHRLGRFRIRVGLTVPLLLMVLSQGGLRAEPPTPDSPPIHPPSEYLRPRTPCPDSLETLVTGLLRDLPGYANRVASRSLNPDAPSRLGSVLVVGEPDFNPIALQPGGGEGLSTEQMAVSQVFFTTLERQYWEGQPFLLQTYNWLFLTPSDAGWHLVFLFSSTGPYPGAGRPPTPPRESTEGILGQAIGLWLRDCRAGAVHPVEGAAVSEGNPGATGTVDVTEDSRE